MKGKIIITDKVYFEPEGLEKPDKNHVKYSPRIIRDLQYSIDLREYEASKQLIEVENAVVIYEWPDEVENPNDDKIYGYSFNLPEPNEIGNTAIMIKNNQNCKAEIKGESAKIIELN